MGRPSKFSTTELLDVAAELLVSGGPKALSAAAVARAAGAPSGSVYHRFESRDHLAASLWMRTVERFDDEVVSGMADPGDPVEVAVAVAVRAVEWSTENPLDAFILTMFRRTDLVADDTAAGLAERADALGARQRAAIGGLASRLGRPVDLVAFAVAGIPLAAIRSHASHRSGVPEWVAGAVGRASRAALSTEGATP